MSVSLHYCIVYSAIQPLEAASVLNKISFSFSLTLVNTGRHRLITGVRAAGSEYGRVRVRACV